jgi:hypothetical protein
VDQVVLVLGTLIVDQETSNEELGIPRGDLLGKGAAGVVDQRIQGHQDRQGI